MYNNEIWTKHTRLILTGVIIVAIAGWVAGILQTASIAIDTANDLLKAAGEEELPLKPFTLSAQTLTIIGYILYLVGLNGFKSIQKNYEASAMVGRISTACGFEIAATLLLFPASFLPVIFGWLFRFGAFVCTIISLILLKSAFEELREEATWSKPALKGAEQLRKSAVYNINLIWMPFVAAAVIVVSIPLFTKGIDFNNLMYTGFDEISRQIKGTVFAVGLEVLAFGLIMLYWSVMQFVLRILGWVNIHAGRLVEETNAQDENSTATASFTPEAQTDTSLYTSHTNTPDTENSVPQSCPSQRNKLLLYSGIALAILVTAICMAFCGSSAKDKFSGTWRFDNESEAAELILDLKSDSTKGTFYFGSKEEMGFFSISFNVASVQVEGNTAKLELTWWDELENKDIIVPATLSLRTDSAKIDITVGNEDTPELECGGYGYIFPVTFTLDRISDRTTPENGDESGNEPETANEPTAEMVETDAPTEKTTDVTEEDYSQPFRGTWSWTDEMIHNDYYDDDIPAAVVTLKLDFYNANSVKGDGGTADGWMNLATTSPQRVSENKITLNEVIGNKAFITVLDGYSEMAEYQATITFNPANKTLEFELGDLIGELDENQAFIAGQSPTGNYSRVILKRKSE